MAAECKVGAKINLKIEINGKVMERKFTLSGYYKGDVVSMAQMVVVSKVFQEKYASTPTLSAMGHAIDASDYDGRISADFNFRSSFGIARQAKALCKRLGFPETANIGVNWAYLGQGDVETAMWVVLLLILILLSGYLIIYNVFSIHVYQDIAYYGLLKTIGTTGKQLKKMLCMEGGYYALCTGLISLIVSALVNRTVVKKFGQEIISS